MWVRGHWRWLKVVPFESLGTVSYSPSIVTMAVCLAISEIFSVKQWRDLENQVKCRSRSLNIAPFDRPYATFYSSAIVNIALSCTIFEFIWRWIIFPVNMPTSKQHRLTVGNIGSSCRLGASVLPLVISQRIIGAVQQCRCSLAPSTVVRSLFTVSGCGIVWFWF